jgi:hypothetical protein
VGEKNSCATENQKRNKHCHRCLPGGRAAKELLREKSQIRFMINCIFAIPCRVQGRLGLAVFQERFAG